MYLVKVFSKEHVTGYPTNNVNLRHEKTIILSNQGNFKANLKSKMTI